jgi:peptide deformylase
MKCLYVIRRPDMQSFTSSLAVLHIQSWERKENIHTCAQPNAQRMGRGLTPLYAPLKSPNMAVREIIKLPDKRLRLVSEPIKRIDAGIRKLVDEMFETMYDAPGIGLAAIQVGVAKRVVTMDLSKKEDDHKPQVFINPELTWKSEEKSSYEEGCLSIPEYYEEVERPAQVKVKYLDLDGKGHEIEAKGLLATCLQHEIDHTNGVLFIDYISKLKRDRVIKKFIKAAKKEEA